MTTVMNSPTYPIVSWKHTLDTSIGLNLTLGVNSGVATIPAGTYWGYDSTTTAYAAGANSLHGALCQAVVDRLQLAPFSLATPALTGSYIYDTSGLEINVKIEKSGIGGTLNVDFTSDADAKLFGFASTSSFSITDLLGYDITTLNSVGYWAPYEYTVYDDRTSTSRNYVGESIYGDAYYSNIKWGTTKQNMLLQYPYVEATLIFEYRRSNPLFNAGDLTPTDAYNLYESLIDAARENADMRVYLDDGLFYNVKIVDTATLNDLVASIEDVSARGRLWRVTTPYRILNAGTTTGSGVFT